MPETRDPIRVGLIGYGFAGKTFHAPLIAAAPGLELVAVASSAPQRVWADLPGMAVMSDPLELATSSDIDLVVVASPNDTHAPLARAALQAGAHVVVDKPFTLTLEEARGLAALAALEKRILSVFHNRRFDSDFLGVGRVLQEGLLGEISLFESHFDRFRPVVRNRWREKAVPGGGLWYDLGPHLVDQALQLFGLPERVFATIATQRAGGEAADFAHVVLEYGPMRAILAASMLVAGGTNRFTIHGQKGSLIKRRPDGQEAQLLSGMLPGDPGWGEDDDAMTFFDGEEERDIATPAGDQSRYYGLLEKAIRGEGDNPVTPAQAVAVTAVIEAALKSSESGRAVKPQLTPRERMEWV